MKKLIILSLIASLFVVGCQPSAAATQTAAAQPQPTNILSNQCTDRGWANIVNYLYDSDDIMSNADQKTDLNALITQLETITNNIKDVGVDSCTETARKSVLNALDNRIKGLQFMASGDNSSALNYIHYGNRLIILAKEELINYGIEIKYPKK
jgi:hypothetical protein